MSQTSNKNPSKRPSHRASSRGHDQPANLPGHHDATAAVVPEPTIETAIKEIEVGATHLAQAVSAEVQTRTAEALGQLKERLAIAEEKIEKIVGQIPRVGPDAARKLHDLTHDEVVPSTTH